MVQVADVVIIGSGIIGCSVAYNLAKMGVNNIIVLEKEDSIAKGSTGRSASGIRAQFASEINIRLSSESMKILDEFAQDVGTDPDFRHIGYLFLVSSGYMLDVFKRASELQRKHGLEINFLPPDDIKKRYPHLYVEDLLGGFFHGYAGYSDPIAICTGYYKAAKRLGVNFLFETEATGFEIKNNQVSAVNTSKGNIGTRLAINASGPYANLVGKMANVDIPALPYRRIIAVTHPFPGINDKIPLTIDTGTGFYFRKELQGILMGESDKNEPPSFDLSVNWDFCEIIIQHAITRVPRLSEARISRRNSWAGLYSITPDNHAIIGYTPQLQGFFNAVGFCGHGIMHAPAIGKCISEMILEGKSKLVDLSSMSLSRFDGGGKGIIEEASF